jgi:hypothetical protein
MMHKIRLGLVLVLALVMMLAAVLPVSAQGDDHVLCNGLSADDCALLTGAGQQMDGLMSFSTPAWVISFSLEAEGETVEFEASGSGAFSLPRDPADPFTGLAVHLVIDQASIDTPDGSEMGSAEVLVVGSMIYLKVGDQWYGERLTQSDLEDLAGEFDLGELPNMGELGGLDGLGELPAGLPDMLVTTRGDDAEIAGEPVATFMTTIDVPGLLVSLLALPGVGDLLGEAGGGAMDLGEMTPQDMEFFATLIEPFFEGSSLIVSQAVGLDDGYIHQIAVDASLMVDPSLLAMLADQPAGEVGTIAGGLHFMSEIDNINEPIEITIPNDVKPFDELEMESDLSL